MGITMDNVTGVQLDTDPTSLINGFDLTESLTGQKTGKSTADVVMAGGTGERSSAQVYADALEAAGKEWNASKARGDKRGMDAAAWYANKVRAVGEGNITVQKAMSLAGDTYHTGTGAHTAAHNIAEMLRKKDPTTYGKYAKGSKHAKSGLARLFEEGEEYIFSARNGNQYKMYFESGWIVSSKSGTEKENSADHYEESGSGGYCVKITDKNGKNVGTADY